MVIIDAIANKKIVKTMRITKEENKVFEKIRNLKLNVSESDILATHLNNIKVVLEKIEKINTVLGLKERKGAEPYMPCLLEVKIILSENKGNVLLDNFNTRYDAVLNFHKTLIIQKSNLENNKYYIRVYSVFEVIKFDGNNQLQQSITETINGGLIQKHLKSEEELINECWDILGEGAFLLENPIEEKLRDYLIV